MPTNYIKHCAVAVLFGVLTTASSALLAQGSIKLLNAADVATKVKTDWTTENAQGCDTYSRTKIAKVTLLTSAQYKKWVKTLHAGNDPFNNYMDDAAYVKVTFPSQKSGTSLATYGPVDKAAKVSDFKNLIGMPICDNSTGD